LIIVSQKDYGTSSAAYPKLYQTAIFGDSISSSSAFAGSSINRPDSPTFGPLASEYQATGLSYDATFTQSNGGLHHFNDPQASLRSGLSIPKGSNSPQHPSGHFDLQMDLESDFNSEVYPVEGILGFRSQNVTSHPVDADSGYSTMESQAVSWFTGVLYFDP
jgi:hypothetical protein